MRVTIHRDSEPLEVHLAFHPGSFGAREPKSGAPLEPDTEPYYEAQSAWDSAGNEVKLTREEEMRAEALAWEEALY